MPQERRRLGAGPRFAGLLRGLVGPPGPARLQRRRIARQRGRAVEVVICVHDALDHVERCLASVLPTLGRRHRLILVDDGSGAATAGVLDRLAARDRRIRLVRNAARTGYCRAANAGLRLTTADFVILLNSDTVVAPGWIEKLCDAIYTTEGAGIVGPLSSAASYQSIPALNWTAAQTPVNPLPAGLSVAELDRQCEAWTAGQALPRVPLVHGFCFGLRRAVIERIGLFDETLFPDGYGEEDDYCLRAGQAGFALVVATHTYVFHAKTGSYGLAERQLLAEAGARALRARHGEAALADACAALEADPVLAELRRRAGLLYAEAERAAARA